MTVFMNRVLLALSLVLMLTACADMSTPDTTKDTPAPLVLKPVARAELPGWQQDNMLPALQAFAKSCTRILKADPAKNFGPQAWSGTYADWQPACATLPDVTTATEATARAYFETYFTPVAATAGGKADGLFTGYYEASLNGSATQAGPYQTALRRKPDDLVQVDLGAFRDEWKGQRIAGRVVGGSLKPYETREQIIAGQLPQETDLPIVWVDDPVDAFFLHIQGSGVVTMTDGTKLRVGYDAQNGHTYYAIGKELVKRGALKQEDVSKQYIRAWLQQNPAQAAEVMNTNKSYVFFRVLDNTKAADGPIGGEGLSLTPERSLAIDRGQIPYGMPVFVDIQHPDSTKPPLQRVMVAQDTGGAIKGAVRGDVFWGYGPEAEHLAGLMKSPGRYWFLLPSSLARNIP